MVSTHPTSPKAGSVVGGKNSHDCEVNGHLFAYEATLHLAAFPLFTQLSSIILPPLFESQIPSNLPTTRNRFMFHAFVRGTLPSLLELPRVSALRHVRLLFYSCRKTISPVHPYTEICGS